MNVESTERTDENFWEIKNICRLQLNDVLTYSTGAYVGRTNIWLEDKKGIASNHITIIRANGKCDPLFLGVYLNSKAGLLQAERWATGSAQRELYPDAISQFLVYLPSKQFQEKIANLVHQSYQARQKAKGLLEEAKQMVESLIEARN